MPNGAASGRERLLRHPPVSSNSPGNWGRLITQRDSTIWTINIIHPHGPLALRTIGAQLVAAVRAEAEAGLHGMSALWTDVSR